MESVLISFLISLVVVWGIYYIVAAFAPEPLPRVAGIVAGIITIILLLKLLLVFV